MLVAFVSVSVVAGVACGSGTEEQPVDMTAFVGARIIDGTGSEPIEDGVLLVRDGRIEAVGAAGKVDVPSGAEEVDLGGRTIVPGLINAHGHVGGTRGLQGGQYSEENVLRQLGLYARYGVTAVNSLGGDQQEAIAVRRAQGSPELDRARLYFAGGVVTGDTREEARQMVASNAAMEPDFIKIRVDDNLGTADKMSPEVYGAAIDEAHHRGLRVASHLFYLDDAKGLLRAGTDFVAHSVRDQAVDDELIELFHETGVCYCPTLTREISTFVYEDTPEFFDDPFFLKEAGPEVIEQLKDSELQQEYRERPSTPRYKEALRVAQANLKTLADAEVKIAFGTDSGPPARFQGYFEHMELELMAESGLTPMQILVAATGDAAACLGVDEIGTLEGGKLADFIVLIDDPLEEIRNMRSIESVWIAGNRVPDRDEY